VTSETAKSMTLDAWIFSRMRRKAAREKHKQHDINSITSTGIVGLSLTSVARRGHLY